MTWSISINFLSPFLIKQLFETQQVLQNVGSFFWISHLPQTTGNVMTIYESPHLPTNNRCLLMLRPFLVNPNSPLNQNLVGGFNPFEKKHIYIYTYLYLLVKSYHFLRDRDEHEKYLSCHQLENLFGFLMASMGFTASFCSFSSFTSFGASSPVRRSLGARKTAGTTVVPSSFKALTLEIHPTKGKFWKGWMLGRVK